MSALVCFSGWLLWQWIIYMQMDTTVDDCDIAQNKMLWMSIYFI